MDVMDLIDAMDIINVFFVHHVYYVHAQRGACAALLGEWLYLRGLGAPSRFWKVGEAVP